MIKIDQEKILKENTYKLQHGLNYYKPQFILKNDTLLIGHNLLVWVIQSFEEFTRFTEKPQYEYKALYIYNPYPDVFIGINNLGKEVKMIESKDLTFILGWLLGDVVFKMDGERDA